MAETTAIEWTDSTFNPWWGCTKISPACDHCYAADLDKRTGGDHWGNVPRRRTSEKNWNEPRRWQKKSAAFQESHGRRQRVFCASMADVFDNQVPADWRADLWALIRECPDLDWLLLTKRPMNIEKMLPEFWEAISGHVWLGATVEDQQRAEQNIPHLLKHDAAVRFVSVEPMLGAIDWTRWLPTGRPAYRPGGEPFIASQFFMTRCEHCGWCGSSELVGTDSGFDDSDCYCPSCHRAFLCDEIHELDWVIAGGESGAKARPAHPDWFRALRDQCQRADVPFLFKQWGEWHPDAVLTREARPGGECPPPSMRIGKKRAGRLLDGVEHNGFPGVAS
ncbi:protein gp37 [Devosia crocina]|uniref:Protein gp37 n=1 Tax=Devosia crocina TaxID=429728 RepID=A0A1I7N9I2_9HYPH|nr:phage Gp37/Gp68 family protein [Devosia crocina]SFV31233.1 protein gp37 [Devosia crocina]